MPEPLTEPEQRLLASIEAGSEPWSLATAVLVAEAEMSSLAEAEAALASLVAGGRVVFWEGLEHLLVTFTPWQAEDRGVVILEGETEESCRWGEPERELPHFKLPMHERHPSLDDPRFRWVLEKAAIAKMVSDQASADLMDKWTGEPVRLFAGPDGTGAGLTVRIDPRLRKGRTG